MAGLSPGRSVQPRRAVYGESREAVAGSNAYCEPETRSEGVSETLGLRPAYVHADERMGGEVSRPGGDVIGLVAYGL